MTIPRPTLPLIRERLSRHAPDCLCDACYLLPRLMAEQGTLRIVEAVCERHGLDLETESITDWLERRLALVEIDREP